MVAAKNKNTKLELQLGSWGEKLQDEKCTKYLYVGQNYVKSKKVKIENIYWSHFT